MSDWQLRNDSTETLKKRLASWKHDDLPRWLRDVAPKVIADLEAEIAEREGEHLTRLRNSAESADRGEGVSLRGLSREERIARLTPKEP